MPAPLKLTLTDFQDPTQWRWVLSEATGRFLADHTVKLDPRSREYQGFLDLSGYLDYYQEAYSPAQQLADLGAWIGELVFGGLRDKLWANRSQPVRPIRVLVPEQAQELLFRPYELARFANGQSFREAGLRFIYEREGAETTDRCKTPADKTLRILAVFSLPVRQNPLNLRRERYGLQKLIEELNKTKTRAIEFRVLQYGATRDTLEEALQEAEGWDLVHLSGHGDKGELLLEDDQGGTDTINADELGEMLANSAERLKLLILNACYSGAGSHASARVQLGLDKTPLRETGAEGQPVAEASATLLLSLAQQLAEGLDCAALAMRYPVGDAFATDLAMCLYGKLLDKRQSLPAALQLALKETLANDTPTPPLSASTPILFGSRAADLQLIPPCATAETPTLSRIDMAFFPQEPARFVGRLQPMLRASQALAPRSPVRGVLFHGMPGAGKTACALELTYRHAESRFQYKVWHEAPQAGSDISTALFRLLHDIEVQLNAPDLKLTINLPDPQRFREYTLPRLSALLQQYALLLVLDNLENLLTDSGAWRDPLWAEVIAALLKHNGPSRLVLTSRRVPADLEHHAKLLKEPIHALSFAESLLLARELPNLDKLFADPEGIGLLRQTLRVAQGHPKLLELADGLAADRAKLRQQVKLAEAQAEQNGEVLETYFAAGGSHEGETRRSDDGFMGQIQTWTAHISVQLSATARLLFQVLCCLEAEDRKREVIEITWPHILQRMAEGNVGLQSDAETPSFRQGMPEPSDRDVNLPVSPRLDSTGRLPSMALDSGNPCQNDGQVQAIAQTALTESGHGLASSLDTLARVGLIGVEPPADPVLSEEQQAKFEQTLAQHGLTFAQWLAGYRQEQTVYTLHPGIAETARAQAEPTIVEAAEWILGDFHIARFGQGWKTEMQGGGGLIVESARRAAPYLLRQLRWYEAGSLLEEMLFRDTSPENLAFALPMLRRIADANAETTAGLQYAVVLARALANAGFIAEAEVRLRDLIQQATTSDYRLASNIAGVLFDLLLAAGKLEQALKQAKEKSAYTQQAGLGPWTQLLDERSRLQVLNEMGRHDEVLDAVNRLRPQLESLPEQSDAEETATPLNVREALLETGRNAAIYSERNEQALELNVEISRFKAQRGAIPLEQASTRFNDYGPLLRLQRYGEAEKLLLECRAVFEAEHSIEMLGKVWTARAHLHGATSQASDARRFEEIALGFHYQTGRPEDCASSHQNMSTHLQNLGLDNHLILAHRLAAAVIWLQTGSGQFKLAKRNLTRIDCPAQPPRFDDIVSVVEQTEGVRFRALFEQLPRRFPDGDATLAEIWRILGQAPES